MESTNSARTRSPKDILRKKIEAPGLQVNWLAGDGSDRCYFRLSDSEIGRSWVLMQLGDKDREALENQEYDWIHVQEILQKAGLPVPELYHVFPNYGEIVIEDCDNVMFEREVIKLSQKSDTHKIEELYLKAFDLIAKMLKISKSKHEVWCRRAFDKAKLSHELRFFIKHYLQAYLSINLSELETHQLERDVEALSSFLANRPQFFVHRDFHSRNLMINEDKLIIIDFQDAMLGPCSYDLVSLCFDSYVPINLEMRRKLLKEAKYFLSRTVDPILNQELTITSVAMLLQRQLKALGSFAFLTLEKNRGDYLRYSKPAIETLEGTYDKRWPFLSGTLLEKIQ